MTYHDSAAVLLEIRTSPNTAPSVLKSDWLPMTVKGALGGESFVMDFFTVKGEAIAAQVAVEMSGTTERSLAQMLTDGVGDGAFQLPTWVLQWPGILAKIALIRVSSVTGTIYVGRGATSTKPYGLFDSATFSVTGPAAGTSVVLANTSYGIGA